MQIWQRILLALCVAVMLGACAMGPQVTRTQSLSPSADAPYETILVITLYSSFDSRRYLEQEVVKRVEESGTRAVASTSMMDSRTPATRETFLQMVADIEADAVLVTHLVDLETKTKMVDMNPQATYNIRPTYYYNVFTMDLQEYVEPQAADFRHDLVLGTALYSAQTEDIVWAIESKSRIDPDVGELADYSIYIEEADAIVNYLSRDGLLLP